MRISLSLARPPRHLLPVGCWLALLLLAAVPAAAQTGALPVIVAEVREKVWRDRLEALGTLRANESIDLTANVTETISAVHFEDGQQVRQGDLLAEMTSAEEHALLEEARAQFAEAQRQYERSRSLVDKGASSESQTDERRAAFQAAEARRQALESRLADRLVQAPFDGVVGLRQVSVGALVTPGTRIATLDDLSRMKLDFTVPSTYLLAVTQGTALEARSAALPGRTFQGLIATVDTRIDPVTRALTVRALLPNPDHQLRPGLLMNVDVLSGERRALVVPEEAIVPQGRLAFVWVAAPAGQGWQAERRAVTTGGRQPGEVEIVTGLAAGELVVTHGTMQTRPGLPLKIQARQEPGQKLRDILASATLAQP